MARTKLLEIDETVTAETLQELLYKPKDRIKGLIHTPSAADFRSRFNEGMDGLQPGQMMLIRKKDQQYLAKWRQANPDITVVCRSIGNTEHKVVKRMHGDK